MGHGGEGGYSAMALRACIVAGSPPADNIISASMSERGRERECTREGEGEARKGRGEMEEERLWR